jgi:hypothetical protein
VTDVVYVLATVAFFALMIAYIRGCESLGGGTEGEEKRQ